MAETDDQIDFFKRADDIIAVANEQLKTQRSDRVAASTAFGAARFAVWAVCTTATQQSEIAQRRELFLESFITGYRQMLIDNFNDHEKNFDTYHPALTTPMPGQPIS